MIEGPTFETVEAVLPEAVLQSGQADGLWIRDAGWPGVRVVESPLDLGLLPGESHSPVRRVVVQVAVEPGGTLTMSGSNVPWYLGHPDEDLVRQANRGLPVKPRGDDCLSCLRTLVEFIRIAGVMISCRSR